MKTKTISEYSISELRALCQKTAPNPARESKVGLFTRIFSIYLTKAFLYTNIHPNMITVVSVLVFFSGIGMFYFEDMVLQLIGTFLVFLSIVIDGCDGEVARFREQSGPVGGRYVEPVSHDIQYGFSYLFLGIFLALGGASFWFVVIGAIAGISKLQFRLLEIRYWNLVHAERTVEEVEVIKKEYDTKPALIRFVYWVNKNFLTSTGVLPALFIAAVSGRLDLVLMFFGLSYTAFWLALSMKQYWAIYKTYYPSST